MNEVEKVYNSRVATIPAYSGGRSSSRSSHPHLTCYSPLKVRDSIPDLHPLPPITVQRHREREYVVDAIKSDVYYNSPYTRPRRASIIRPYNAIMDRHSAGYFRSPMVREVVTRTMSAQSAPRLPTQSTPRVPPEKRGLHRMSARRRSIPTPPAAKLDQQERSFVLDNIKTERLRNKQAPIVPEYDALTDRHSRRYFRRKVVQSVLRKTLETQQRLYPTITFFAPTKNDIVV